MSTPISAAAFCRWNRVHETVSLSRVATEQITESSRPGAAGRQATSAGVHATLAVLDLLAARPQLGLSDIARELGLAKSTLHRVLAVLVERGWAVRDTEGLFSLGIRALRLGSSSADLPIVKAFRTVAAEFLTRHDETIALAVLDGSESLFLALEETSQPIRLVTHVGSKTPAFASASGRVVLASHPPAAVAALFGGRLLVTPTGRRLNGVAELQTILEEVRERGYAENHGETADGLYAASVPVVNGEGVTIAALTTCIPVSRMTPDLQAEIVEDLKRARPGALRADRLAPLLRLATHLAAPVRIAELRTYVVGNPPPGFGGRYFVFLQLVTDDGVVGVGEVYAATFHPTVVERMVHDVFERTVVGMDPFRIETMWHRTYASGYTARPDVSLVGVLSGIEIACWDIVGKAVGKPVYELLGGRVHERLRSYTYLYTEPGDATDVYLDPALAAERAAAYADRGFTALKFDPAGAYSAFDPRQPELEALDRSEAYVERDPRGGRLPLRPALRHPRAVHRTGRDPPGPPPRAVRSPLARGARPARHAGGDGRRRPVDVDPDRDRGAADDEVRVRPRARDGRRADPAAEPRPGGRHPRGQEDRGARRGALRADRAAPLLRARRRGGEHPARRVQRELPRPRGNPRLGRLPCGDPPATRCVGGRVRRPVDGAGARRRARRGGGGRASLRGTRAASATCSPSSSPTSRDGREAAAPTTPDGRRGRRRRRRARRGGPRGPRARAGRTPPPTCRRTRR